MKKEKILEELALKIIKKEISKDEVDIVAHSMGGLVARSFIQSSKHLNEVRNFVMVGTPNSGSASTYPIWEGGDPMEVDILLGGTFAIIFFNEGDISMLKWNILYFLFTIFCVFLSVKMKSTSILSINTLFLLLYISYNVNEYFSNSVSFPFLIIVLGFIFLLFGYLAFHFNKKYIKN